MLTFARTTIAFADDRANADAITTHHMEEAMFPGAHASIDYNDAGEVTGWDYPGYDDSPDDPDDFDEPEEDEDDGPAPRRYATLTDAINQDLIPALHEFADDYDIDAIAAEVYEYQVDHDAQGNELLNTAGFAQKVTTDEFWRIVRRFKTS